MGLIVATGACGAALVRGGPTGFDEGLLLWFRAGGDTAQLAGPSWILAFWQGTTWLGDGIPRIVVASLVLAGLLGLRRWQSGVFMAGVLLSGIVLSTVLKQWVGRPRPQLVEHFDHVTSASFPSGHALNSTLFYLVVALLLGGMLRRRCARRTVWFAAAILSFAIGVSRIALGVHYPTDVVAGWVAGAAWLWLWVSVARCYWPVALPGRSDGV